MTQTEQLVDQIERLLEKAGTLSKDEYIEVLETVYWEIDAQLAATEE